MRAYPRRHQAGPRIIAEFPHGHRPAAVQLIRKLGAFHRVLAPRRNINQTRPAGNVRKKRRSQLAAFPQSHTALCQMTLRSHEYLTKSLYILLDAP